MRFRKGDSIYTFAKTIDYSNSFRSMGEAVPDAVAKAIRPPSVSVSKLSMNLSFTGAL